MASESQSNYIKDLVVVKTKEFKEVKELLKDIPENELKQFLNETAETEASTDEETIFMN